MLTYISFAYHTMREQQLIASPVIAEYLYGYARHCLAADPRLTFAGVLASHELPFDLGDAPFTLMPTSDRLEAEHQGIRALSQDRPTGEHSEWCVVLRPGMGALSCARLRSFCDVLEETPASPDAALVAESVVEHNLLTNPIWNLRAAPKRFQAGNEIRLPRVTGMAKDTLDESCPELHAALDPMRVSRSQDVPTAYYGDGALYAMRCAGEDVPLPGAQERMPVSCRMGPESELPLLFRLPVFSLGRHQPLDCASLERLCRLEQRGEQSDDRDTATTK